MRHLVAEAGRNFFVGRRRVFDRIVQQAGRDRGRVHLHLRQHFRHFQRMNDVRLAGGALLARVMLHAEFPRFANQRDVFAGTIGLHLAQQRLEAGVDHLLSDFGLLRRRGRSGLAAVTAAAGRTRQALRRCRQRQPGCQGRGGHRSDQPETEAGRSPCFIIGRFCSIGINRRESPEFPLPGTANPHRRRIAVLSGPPALASNSPLRNSGSDRVAHLTKAFLRMPPTYQSKAKMSFKFIVLSTFVLYPPSQKGHPTTGVEFTSGRGGSPIQSANA